MLTVVTRTNPQRRLLMGVVKQQKRNVHYITLDVPWIPESPPMKFVGPKQNIPVEDAPTLEEWRKTNDDPLKHMTAAERNAYVDGNRGWSPIFKRQNGFFYHPKVGYYGRFKEPADDDLFGQWFRDPKVLFTHLFIYHAASILPRWAIHAAIILPLAYYMNYRMRVHLLGDKAAKEWFVNGGIHPFQWIDENVPY